jgi:small subunit ribosomal protein S21
VNDADRHRAVVAEGEVLQVHARRLGGGALVGDQKYRRRYIENMLIIDSKDCENIDKALKKYKKKFEKSKVLLQLRERQSFTKPSVRRRNQVLKAVYKQKINSGQIEL